MGRTPQIKDIEDALITALSNLPVIELMLNGGFEQGFAQWAPNFAVLSSAVKHSGSFSAELTLAGDTQDGAASIPFLIDETLTYDFETWYNVTAISAGQFRVLALYYSDDAGTVLTGGDTLVNHQVGSGPTVGWEEHTCTLGLVGSGADFEWPAGTKSVAFKQRAANAFNGTGYSDDFSLARTNDYLSPTTETYIDQLLDQKMTRLSQQMPAVFVVYRGSELLEVDTVTWQETAAFVLVAVVKTSRGQEAGRRGTDLANMEDKVGAYEIARDCMRAVVNRDLGLTLLETFKVTAVELFFTNERYTAYQVGITCSFDQCFQR